MEALDTRHIAVGAVLGVAAAATAAIWATATKLTKGALRRVGLDEHETPVLCGVLGGLSVGLLGAALPPTLFWG
jgi:hypothetical protein